VPKWHGVRAGILSAFRSALGSIPLVLASGASNVPPLAPHPSKGPRQFGCAAEICLEMAQFVEAPPPRFLWTRSRALS
jgi:hypothetical protein